MAVSDSAGRFDAVLARVPADALRREGVCPFECCVYGEWRADTAIAVRARPDIADAVQFTMAAREWFRADSGFVQVTQPGVVLVSDTVRADRVGGRRTLFEAGDTVVLLDYIGEGYWNVWHDGEVVEQVAQFWGDAPGVTAGALQGGHRREWWVRARDASGRSGWFPADSVRFSGADACSTIDG